MIRAIEAQGRRGFALQADSADAAAVARSVEEAAGRLGGLDILVNNAGIARYGTLPEMGLDDIDALPAVNIRGPVLAARAAIPMLGEGGRIISIGPTLVERVPFGSTTVYSLTKSALLALRAASHATSAPGRSP